MGTFSLTKREQCVIILIVVALIAGTIVVRYRDLRSPVSPLPAQPSASPFFEADEDRATPNESP
jgi:hypothetical protein